MNKSDAQILTELLGGCWLPNLLLEKAVEFLEKEKGNEL